MGDAVDRNPDLDMATDILERGLADGLARGFPPLGPYLVPVSPDALRLVLDALAAYRAQRKEAPDAAV